MNIDQKNELVALYLSECNKLLTAFDKIIMDSDTMDELADAAELFRILHTLKGSSAMMEYLPLVDLSHRFENILSKIKEDGIIPTGKSLQFIIDAGIEFSAYLHKQLSDIQDGKAVTGNDKLGKQLDELIENFGVSVIKTEANAVSSRHAGRVAVDGEICIKVRLRECPLPHIRASVVAKSVKSYCSFISTYPENIDKAQETDSDILENGFEIHLVLLEGRELKTVTDKISSQPYVISCSVIADEKVSQQGKSHDLAANVTVSQVTVNNLIHYIDELASEAGSIETYIENSGLQNRKTYDLLSALKHTLREVGAIASGIGTHSLESLFMQMHMTVRNMSRELNKNIKVQLSGADIQVDKSILEILSDSLIHIVRNAADHGIEPPDERKAAGKPETGTITLSASKKNDYLTVTVSDDGRGVQRQNVLEFADKKGLLKKPGEEYTDTEVGNLLFISGVSTKEDVTQYSGRGVGLDTVVRRVRQVGGRATVESHAGKGTTFSLKIPMTLTMIDGIEATLDDGSQIVIPTNAVMHISVIGKAIKNGQKLEYGENVYKRLRLPGDPESVSDDEGYILFLTPDFGSYYLCVKKISMMASYYVKQLPECVSDNLGREYIYSGCVLCADSRLRCILDAEKLIAMSEVGLIREVYR